ncbi:MAG: hypothetical protein E6833_35875, partial [Bradyrhizobium sp.]|nr:hypothetical protein [Bradyrhizobium sp.]
SPADGSLTCSTHADASDPSQGQAGLGRLSLRREIDQLMKNNLNEAGDPAAGIIADHLNTAFGDKAACSSAERRYERA